MKTQVNEGLGIRLFSRVLSVLGIGLLAGAVLCGQGQSQSDGAPTGKAPAKAPAPEKAASQGINTGIKVHGHWIIEVKNPDGTVATHREFENSLTNLQGYGGTQALALLLTGQAKLGSLGWVVGLQSLNSGNTSPCGQTSTLPPGCYVGPATLLPGNNVGPGGSSNVPSQVMVSGTVPGTAVTAAAGTIDTVAAFIWLSDFSKEVDYRYEFSSATLTPTIVVYQGQSINAAVTYSFQ
jgi:hypothetical protein